jgi:hypothetical protein|tara:strand:- start:729 stop:1211 length:483 start_codon:yes stop_codon:yes gene_type:complete
MKVIQNFLEKDYFNSLKETITGKSALPFYLNPVVRDNEPMNPNNYYFTHVVWRNYRTHSDIFNMFEPLLDQIKCKGLLRIKINCYPRTEKIFYHEPHTDYSFSTKGFILSLNTCDGGTQVEDKFVKSVENQALFFDTAKPHNSTTCTDQHCRFNVNINYF